MYFCYLLFVLIILLYHILKSQYLYESVCKEPVMMFPVLMHSSDLVLCHRDLLAISLQTCGTLAPCRHEASDAESRKFPFFFVLGLAWIGRSLFLALSSWLLVAASAQA